MAEQGRRAVVQDPLELGVNQQAPDRSLGLGGVRNPGQSAGDADYQQTTGLLGAVGKLTSALGEVYEEKKSEWETEGKLQYLRGATEAEIDASGNQYTKQGWQSLNVVAKANEWYSGEVTALQNGGYEKDPAAYQAELMERRAKALENLPSDPVQRKLFVAAFDDLGPRLMTQHTAAHNTFNKEQTRIGLRKVIETGSSSNADATKREAGQPLAMSAGQVRTIPATPINAEDRDVLIKTMLGEANGEGATGLAAVAHVILNRVQDGKFGNSVRAVALAPKQFSTWNSGAGGNNPGRYNPNSEAYKQAAAVADAVLSGRNPDVTNGATHYYSPKGMDALVAGGSQKNTIPSWLAAEEAKSKGRVVIGGHIFVGKAGNARVDNEASNIAVAGNSRGADPAIINKYKNTSDEDLKGMAEDKKSPDWMRAETAAVLQGRLGGGPQAGERGGENAKLANAGAVEAGRQAAPQDVAAASGVVTREVPSGPTTQLQATIRGLPNMRPAEKGEVLAETIVDQLKAGNDQAYRDAGGIGFLNELGTDGAKVRMVQTAYKQFQDAQLNKFDLDNQKWQSGIVDQVREGKLSEPEAMAAIEGRLRQGKLSDQHARSLASRVESNADKAGKAFNLKPDAQRDLLTLYQKQTLGALSPEDAYMQLQAIAKEHNLPQEQVNRYIKQIWDTEQGDFNSKITEAKTVAKKREVEEGTKAKVMTALSNQNGLKDVQGPHIERVDPRTGQKTMMSPQQWGIEELKSRTFAAAKGGVDAQIAAGQNPEQARGAAVATAEAIIYANLAKQDVVDESLKGSLTAAATGNIIMKDGKIDPDALRSFDTFMRMSRDPNVGPEYTSKYFSNDASRNLLMTADEQYTGGLNPEQALRKAHEIMQSKPKNGEPGPTIVLDDTFRARSEVVLKEKMSEIRNQHWSKVPSFLGSAGQYNEQSLNALTGKAQTLAAIYKSRDPQVSDEVHTKKASEDIAKGTVLVGNNLIYGDDRKGQRLDQVMGVEGFGKDAPHKAVDEVVQEYLRNKTASYMKDGMGDSTGWGKFGRDNFVSTTSWPPAPTKPYWAHYDANAGIMYIKPWKDATMKEAADIQPLAINVREVGAKWKAKQNESVFTGDNPFAKMLKVIPNLVGKAGETSRDPEFQKRAMEYSGADIN